MNWRTSGKFRKKPPTRRGLPPGRRLEMTLDADSFQEAYSIVWGPPGLEYRVNATERDIAIASAWKYYEQPFFAGTTEQQWIDAVQSPRVPVSVLWYSLVSVALDELTLCVANKLGLQLVLLYDHSPPGTELPPEEDGKRAVEAMAKLSNEANAGIRDGIRQLADRFSFEFEDPDHCASELPAWRKVFETCAAAWDLRMSSWFVDVRKEIEQLIGEQTLVDIWSRRARVAARGPATRILLATAAVHDLRAAGQHPIPFTFQRNAFRTLASDSWMRVIDHFMDKGILYNNGFLTPEAELKVAHECALDDLREHDEPLLSIIRERLPSALEPALPSE